MVMSLEIVSEMKIAKRNGKNPCPDQIEWEILYAN